MTSAGTSISIRRRRLALVLYAVGFFICVLMPFQMRWPAQSLATLVASSIPPSWSPAELGRSVGHIVLFAPLGVMIAARCGSSVRRSVAWFMVAAALAIGSEAAQAFVERSVSLGDAVADCVGCLVGYLVYRSGVLQRVHPKPVRLLAAVSIVVAMMVAVVARVPIKAGIETWDQSYLLHIGNEATDDRPWAGVLGSASILVGEMSIEDAAAWSVIGAAPPEQPARNSPPFDLQIPRDDATATSLQFAGLGGSAIEMRLIRAGDVNVLDGRMLQLPSGSRFTSTEPPEALYDAIAAAGAFAIRVEVRPDSLDQGGPARILSASLDTSDRNFTLGQGGDGLVFRVRNRWSGDNGSDPQLQAPACLNGEAIQCVVAAYTGWESNVFVDGRHVGSLRFTPLLGVSRLFTRAAPGVPGTTGLIVLYWIVLVACAFTLTAERPERPIVRQVRAVAVATMLAAASIAVPSIIQMLV